MYSEITGCLECHNIFEKYPGDETCLYCGSLRIKNVYELVEIASQIMTGMDANYREVGIDWDE